MKGSPTLREPEPLAERVGGIVRGLCAQFGLKQSDVAEVLGVSQSQVSQRFRGAFALTLPELEILAELFSTTPAYLMGYAVEPRPVKPARGPGGWRPAQGLDR